MPSPSAKHEELARELEALEQTSPDLDSTLDNTISDELLRLGRILAELTPTEPEVHDLVALMEIQASHPRHLHRQPVLLFDQNRIRWDQLLIRLGLTGRGCSYTCSDVSCARRIAVRSEAVLAEISESPARGA
jgi:predicted RNA polymerase sigma factor